MSRTIAARTAALLERLGVPASAYTGGTLASFTPVTGQEIARLKTDTGETTAAAIARVRGHAEGARCRARGGRDGPRR